MLRTCQTDICDHREPCVHFREMFMSTCFVSICPSCGSESDPLTHNHVTQSRLMSIWNKSQSSDSFKGSPDYDFIIISQHFVVMLVESNCVTSGELSITVTTRAAQNLGLNNWLDFEMFFKTRLFKKS